jgi:hypothetical protein
LSTKENYLSYCDQHSVTLGFQPQWLDAFHKSWEVLYCTYEMYSAFWVFHPVKRLGFRMIRNPYFTPYTGYLPCQDNIPEAVHQILIEQLLSQLPKMDVMEIDLLPQVGISFTSQTTSVRYRHTNILELSTEPSLYQGIRESTKRQIRKAEKDLKIQETNDINLMFTLFQKTFEKQRQKTKLNLDMFSTYWEVCRKNDSGRLFVTEDREGNPHATLWLAYDDDTAYYLAGGTDASFYGSGAMSGLMWHAIKTSIDLKKKYFDFEGSDLPGVDRFFKNFGPKEVPYMHLYQHNSLLYRAMKRKNSK